MKAIGWSVLALVFADELAAMAAYGVTGWHLGGALRWLLAVVLALAGMTVWSLFASPKATYGGPLRRPVAKIVVFGLASLLLWRIGHGEWALALLVFSVVVNGLAQLPGVRGLALGREAESAP